MSHPIDDGAPGAPRRLHTRTSAREVADDRRSAPGAGGSALGDRPPQWVGAWVVLGTTTTVLVVAAYRADPSWALHNTLQVMASLTLVAIAVRVAGSARELTVGTRLLLAAAPSLWYLGDLLGLLSAVRGQNLVWIPPAEACYLAAQVLFAGVGLGGLHHAMGRWPVRRLADGLLVGSAVAFGLWTLGTETAPSATRAGYAIATLLADGTMLAVALFVFLSTDWRSRRVLVPLCLSPVVLLAADVGYTFRASFSSTLPAWTLDVGWALASVLASIGLLQLRRAVISGRPARLDPDVSAPWLVPTALGTVVVVAAISPPDEWHPVSAGLILLVIGCVALREVALSVEGAALAREARAAHEALRRQAREDGLTGLANRRALFEELEVVVRSVDRPIAIAFLDLDDFKSVNDTFGHHIGDRVIIEAADRLRSGLPDAVVVARIGGDEFVVAFPHEGSAEVAAHRITDLFDGPFRVGGADIAVAPSVGISLLAGTGATVDDVLADADRRAYEAKRRSRPSAADRPLVATTDVEQLSELTSALQDGSIEIWFQPVLHAATGGVTGASALARWRAADGRVVPAQEFLAPLLASGHRLDLLRLLIDQACARFGSGRPEADGWFVSLPIGREDLLVPTLPALIGEGLERHGLAPHRLQLELQIPPGQHHTLLEPVARVRDLGVAVGLDGVDRWGGIAGLVSLKPTVLKFSIATDRRAAGDLVSGSPTGPTSAQLVQVAHDLGLTVHAKQVETPAQGTSARAMGCDLVQGNLWAAALPFEQLADLPGVLDPGHGAPRPVG